MVQVSNQLLRRLCRSFCRAFDYDELEQLLRLGVDKNLETISLGKNLEQVVYDVLVDANQNGWISDLLKAAKEERSQDAAFVALSDSALASMRFRQELQGTPADLQKRRKLNIPLAVGLCIAGATWVFRIRGPWTAWTYVLALVPFMASLPTDSKLLQTLSRLLRRFFDHPKALLVLILVAVVLLSASLFVGSVEIAWYREVPVQLQVVPDKSIEISKPGWFSLVRTNPFAPRSLTLRLNRSQPRTIKVYPWRRCKLTRADFRPTPYLLLVAPDELLVSIPAAPRYYWELVVRSDERDYRVAKYNGQPIWLGPKADLPPIPQEERAQYQNSFRRGNEEWTAPVLELNPGAVLEVALLAPDEMGNLDEFLRYSIVVHDPDPDADASRLQIKELSSEQ